MIRAIHFARAKYGGTLLADVADVDEMPTFIQGPEPHALRFTEIMLVHEGTGTLSLDGEDQPVAPGVALVTAPGQVRSWRLRRPLRATTAFFDDAFGAEPPAAAAVPLDGRRFAELHATLCSLAACVRARGPAAGPDLRAGLASVLAALPRRRSEGVLARRFERLVARGERLRVADYARRLGVTPEHLCRAVQAQRGRPPSAILHAQLLLETRRALLYTDETLGALAERLGFCDASHLGRFFRRHAGMSPGACRRRQGRS